MEYRSGDIINRKYRILSKLGEGGMAAVYRAEDLEHKKEVAVKFLKQNRISGFLEDKIRFRKEVDVVSRFNHPHIAGIFGQDEHDGIPFIVMELVEGESLHDILQSRRVFTIEESLRIISQTAEALDYVHNRNIIHRDLKPGNILIDKKSGKAMLLDFGLALVMELREIREADEIIGTFGYMSPEATGIINKPVDERSDLYSLGIIFYRLITGELPFTGGEISQILHKQVAVTPARPAQLNLHLPRSIDEIIMKLLEKEPELRYQSAKGLLHDLERIRKGEENFVIGERDQKIKLTFRSRLVGREQEFGTLKKLFEQAQSGSGGICFIAGEAGIGKSRLVDELRGYIYERGGSFYMSKCFSQENKIPFYPFRDMVDEYVRKIKKEGDKKKKEEKARLRKAFGGLSGLLIRFNPNMADIIGETEEVPVLDDPEKENRRFLIEYSRFITHLCESTSGLALFIDDIQWADEASLNLVEELLKRISRENMLLMATFRTGEISPSHSIYRIKSEAALMSYPLQEISLGYFNFERMRRLAAEILGEEEEKAEAVTRYLMDKTGGNPFFAIILLRELVERKALVWDKGGWAEDAKKMRDLPVTSNIVDMILLRLKDLPEKESELLTIGSVIGKEFELALLPGLMKDGEEDIIALVDSTIEKQLLEQSGRKGSVIFVHDRIRDAFYSRMTAEERRQYHFRIARVLEERGREGSDQLIFELAHHYIEAGEKEKSLEYSVQAAEKARENYALEEAIKYYKVVISLYEEQGKRESPEWLRCQEELTDLYLSTGKNDEVIRLCSNILERKKGNLEKARIFHKMGAAHQKKASYAEAEEAIGRGLALLGERLPRSRSRLYAGIIRELLVHILHSFFIAYYMKKRKKNVKEKDVVIILTCIELHWMHILTDTTKFLYSCLRALNIVQARIGRSRELGIILSSYGSLCMAIPLFRRSLKYHKKALEIKKEIRDEQEMARTLQFIGYYHQWKGEYRESISYFEQSIGLYRKISDIWNLGMTLQGLGITYLYLGDFKPGLTALQEYLKISEEIKDEFGILSCLGYMVEIFIEQGDLDSAESTLSRGYALASRQALPFPLLGMHMGLGHLHLERQNPDKAVEFLNKAREINEQHELLKNYTLIVYFTLADAMIEKQKGQRRADRKELKRIGRICRFCLRGGKTWITHYSSCLRVYAKYLALCGKRKRAERVFLKSMRESQRIGRPYELAKGLYEYGRFLLHQDKIEKAAYYFQKAFKTAESIGSAGLAGRCAAELGLDLKAAVSRETPKERLQIEREMTTILETSRYFSSILLLDELLERITEKAIQLVGAERAILLLYPEEERGERTLDVRIAKNVKEGEIETEAFLASRNIISKVEIEKKPLILEDASLDKDWKNESSIIQQGIRSVMCLPIQGKEEMLGILYLDNRLVSGLFVPDDLKIMEIIFRQAGISIENAILYKKAITDGLTTLYNHSFFENFLMKSVSSANRYRGKVSLLMADIDLFKKFNDTYGHRAGDLILKNIAEIINKTVRRSDIAARYGGEEFSVVLPETGLNGGRTLAEKLRKAIEKNKIVYKEGDREKEFKITVSIGVAELHAGEEWTDLVLRADKALYKAKESGRNRVEYL